MSLRHSMYDVRSAHNANELVVLHDWNSFDLALGEEQGNLADRGLFADRNDFMAHNIRDVESFPVNLADNIGFCDNTYNIAIFIDNGQAANALFIKQLCCFLRACLRPDSANFVGHDISCDHIGLLLLALRRDGKATTLSCY